MALIQSASNTNGNGGGGTMAITLAQATQKGSMALIAFMYRSASGQTVSSVTDSAGQTYTLIKSQTTGNHYTCALYACYGSVAGVTTVTIVLSAAGVINGIFAEESVASGLDGTPSGAAQSSVTAVNSGTTTTDVPNTVLYGFLGSETQTTAFTPSGNWVTVTNTNNTTDGDGFGMVRQTVNGSGSAVALTVTVGTSGGASAFVGSIVAAFKRVASALSVCNQGGF